MMCVHFKYFSILLDVINPHLLMKYGVRYDVSIYMIV